LFLFEPWSYLQQIPGSNFLLQYWNQLLEAVVQWLNRHLFHLKEVLIYPNGSGDTSFGWAQQYSIILVALFIGLV